MKHFAREKSMFKYRTRHNPLAEFYVMNGAKVVNLLYEHGASEFVVFAYPFVFPETSLFDCCSSGFVETFHCVVETLAETFGVFSVFKRNVDENCVFIRDYSLKH